MPYVRTLTSPVAGAHCSAAKGKGKKRGGGGGGGGGSFKSPGDVKEGCAPRVPQLLLTQGGCSQDCACSITTFARCLWTPAGQPIRRRHARLSSPCPRSQRYSSQATFCLSELLGAESIRGVHDAEGSPTLFAVGSQRQADTVQREPGDVSWSEDRHPWGQRRCSAPPPPLLRVPLLVRATRQVGGLSQTLLFLSGCWHWTVGKADCLNEAALGAPRVCLHHLVGIRRRKKCPISVARALTWAGVRCVTGLQRGRVRS